MIRRSGVAVLLLILAFSLLWIAATRSRARQAALSFSPISLIEKDGTNVVHINTLNIGSTPAIIRLERRMPDLEMEFRTLNGTSKFMLPRLSGGPALLLPGQSMTTRVVVPPEVMAFRAGLEVTVISKATLASRRIADRLESPGAYWLNENVCGILGDKLQLFSSDWCNMNDLKTNTVRIPENN